MNQSQRIDFGIVNYNGGTALTKCIQTILGLKGIQSRIFILDNASTDNSLYLAKNQFDECTYIELDHNIGYAGACNKLIQYLESHIIVLCNMDLEFDSDWGLNLLKCFIQNPEAVSVSTAVYDRETGKLYSGGVFYFHDLYPLSSEVLLSKDQPYDVTACYGAVMTFRREIFNKIGGFDEDYFLFFEETEFYLRMSINNLKTIYCPTARVFHFRSVSSIRYSPLKLFYSERNRVWTAFKYLPYWYFPLTFIFSILRFITMAKSGIPENDGQGKKVKKSTIIFTIFKAWIEAILKMPNEFEKRKKIWAQTKSTPIDTLKIIKQYPLSFSDLKVK